MARGLISLLVIVFQRILLKRFIDENDLLQVHDVTMIVPKILEVLLTHGKTGMFIFRNLEFISPKNSFTISQ